jgi:hypothetical protein
MICDETNPPIYIKNTARIKGYNWIIKQQLRVQHFM